MPSFWKSISVSSMTYFACLTVMSFQTRLSLLANIADEKREEDGRSAFCCARPAPRKAEAVETTPHDRDMWESLITVRPSRCPQIGSIAAKQDLMSRL